MNAFLDLDLVQLIAADLGVDASFVEKDWYAMRIIAALITVDPLPVRLAFCGGTSLSKGFNAIERFSEDLDFKVILPPTGVNRNQRRSYRTQWVDAVRTGSSEWSIDDANIHSHNQGRFFDCQIIYQQNFEPATSLRHHIKLEVTFKSPALPVEERSLQSFIAKANKHPPEVPLIACVSPIETAADKLSALTWRVLSRQRGQEGDDPTLIRHLYDLTALEDEIVASENFTPLVVKLLDEDAKRGLDLSKILPTERLQRMLQCLEDDSVYEDEYDRFVTGMSYAAENSRPSFARAVTALRRLVKGISNN
ncbi:MAG: nucleotidyl transferase AbiEii/AbiGii toxin family protein [Cyanobacteriota bacterium]|nr:nucleotidyl transferase AbiEii/AbiGii toxin family protein [Cyanobacteriota bacterium]